MENNMIVFIDNIGRTIMGEEAKSNGVDLISVKNPAVIFAQPNPQNGQLNIQVIPLFFRELTSGKCKEDGIFWSYQTSHITKAANLELDPRLLAQYKQITTPQISVPPTGAGTPPKIVKLFDDSSEKKS